MFRKHSKQSKLDGFGFEPQPFYNAQALIRSLAFHPSGQSLCIGSGDGQIEIFDTLHVNQQETRFPKFVGQQYHKQSILNLRYSPDGSCIASCSNDKTIRLIDMRDLSCRYRAAYHNNIQIKPQHILHNGHTMRCIHFPSCLQVLSGESGQCSLRLWDITKCKLIGNWNEHIRGITAIQSYDNLIVTSGIDKKIVVWDLNQPNPINVINRYPARVNDIKLIKYPSDYHVIAAYADNALICYSLARGCIVWQCVAHQTSCNALSISTDNKLCLSSSLNGQIVVNQCRTGQLLSTLRQTHGNVTIEWNPTQAMFASATHKGVVNFWQCTI